ncbi:MAG: hypothetical protein IT299_12375 [Dehalococcoidia bacterium]|nr:hypothetical protein [Dehalococcoidia bacterium]
MTGSASAARPPSFYERALAAAEHTELLEAFREALDEQGLTGEAALLRALLRSAIEQHPEDADLVLSGVRLLVNVLIAQHRLSGAQAEDMATAIAHAGERVLDVVRGTDDAS